MKERFRARTLTKNGIKYERISSKEDILEFEGGFSSMVMKTMGFQPGTE